MPGPARPGRHSTVRGTPGGSTKRDTTPRPGGSQTLYNTSWGRRRGGEGGQARSGRSGVPCSRFAMATHGVSEAPGGREGEEHSPDKDHHADVLRVRDAILAERPACTSGRREKEQVREEKCFKRIQAATPMRHVAQFDANAAPGEQALCSARTSRSTTAARSRLRTRACAAAQRTHDQERLSTHSVTHGDVAAWPCRASHCAALKSLRGRGRGRAVCCVGGRVGACCSL